MKTIDTTLLYDSALSPLGLLFVAWHTEGLCCLAFAHKGSEDALARASARWRNAVWTHKPGLALDIVRRIFTPPATPHITATPLPLFLCGTAFQVRVWQALLKVPAGQTISYQELAAKAGAPGAARAVGSAMARNPLIYIVPCHRVVRADGTLGHYGGGVALKQRLLDEEARTISENRMTLSNKGF